MTALPDHRRTFLRNHRLVTLPPFVAKGQKACTAHNPGGSFPCIERPVASWRQVPQFIVSGPMPTPASQPAIAVLHGAFTITTAAGAAVVLQGQLRRALLAVLLCAPGQARARATLIEMFWADKDPAKAAASLRSALSELRKDLAVLGADVITADRTTIRIPSHLLVAARAGQDDVSVFLEGMDLAMAGADGFEDWLRSQRASGDDAPMVQNIARFLPADFGAPVQETAIGLLPCRFAVLDPQLETAAHRVQDMVFDALADVLHVRMFDYRDNFGIPGLEKPDLQSGNGPRLVAQATYVSANAGLHIKLMDSFSQEVLWAGDLPDVLPAPGGAEPDSAARQANVSSVVEQIVLALTRAPAYGEAVLMSPYQALISMFHLENGKMDALQLQLESSALSGGMAVHHALLLYMATIRTGESIGTMDMSALSNVIEVARMTTQSPDFKAYNLSMAGYALNYLSGETDLALDLAESAVSLAPNQAFCWDQLALCHFSNGRLDAADHAAQRAQTLGLHSPIRYTYDSTAAMIAFAKRDYARAARVGNRALFRMPKFTPALTYTAAALMQLGQLGDARRLVSQLRLVRPDYTTQNIKTSTHLPSVDAFPARFADSLKRAGLT